MLSARPCFYVLEQPCFLLLPSGLTDNNGNFVLPRMASWPLQKHRRALRTRCCEADKSRCHLSALQNAMASFIHQERLGVCITYSTQRISIGHP